jgi:hypothetical protein
MRYFWFACFSAGGELNPLEEASWRDLIFTGKG